ncbi:hypothetical protein L1049_000522 [Liquidambar formosana]|uniref:Rab3GAP catalytic subunit conserved domain-containing protein n=1 Tax=Liquidambar formosana TaxID=63359 RepID=A0AAP0NBL7_LIQFO
MEASSIVSKARTAFHSAAAKAERVLTDIKSDLKSDHRDSDRQSPGNPKKQSESESPDNDGEPKPHHESKHLRWRPAPIGTKQDWHDRFKNIRIGKKGVEDTEKADNSNMSFPIFDENLCPRSPRSVSEPKGPEMVSPVGGLNATTTDNIPSSSVMKQLAIALEAGKKFKSMKNFMASSRDSSPVRERAGLSLSAVKSLVLRDKEEKFTPEFGGDEKVLSLIHSLLDAEGHFLRRKITSGLETHTAMTSLPRDIHGAPPESFVVKLSEVIGSFKTLRKMALFWCRVVAELRRLWLEGRHIPGIPLDEIPDLSSCLLYQQLQVINCCVSRKRRRIIATESLDSVIGRASSNVEESAVSGGMVPASPVLYARVSTGELVLRLGADHLSENLTMLETGEPVYSPITQEGPLLTEDLIKETEEFVLRTGSVGAGCSQLLSDMQAFKKILLDGTLPLIGQKLSWVMRLRTPLMDGDLLSTRGQLSSRMQKEGNLWRELWETAKPVPAVKQTPLFEEDLAVEGILNVLEGISPSELFEQLFVSLLGLGFVVAEAMLSTNSNLSKLFYECKDYIVATCQGPNRSEKVDDLCQVYETVETMLLRPEEVLKVMKQPEEVTTSAGEPKSRLKRLSLYFGGKDRHPGKPALKDQKNTEENPTRQSFSSFFDGKSSLFSKKPPKPDSASPADRTIYLDENDWTVV